MMCLGIINAKNYIIYYIESLCLSFLSSFWHSHSYPKQKSLSFNKPPLFPEATSPTRNLSPSFKLVPLPPFRQFQSQQLWQTPLHLLYCQFQQHPQSSQNRLGSLFPYPGIEDIHGFAPKTGMDFQVSATTIKLSSFEGTIKMET